MCCIIGCKTALFTFLAIFQKSYSLIKRWKLTSYLNRFRFHLWGYNSWNSSWSLTWNPILLLDPVHRFPSFVSNKRPRAFTVWVVWSFSANQPKCCLTKIRSMGCILEYNYYQRIMIRVWLRLGTGSSISLSKMKPSAAIMVGLIHYIETPLGTAFSLMIVGIICVMNAQHENDRAAIVSKESSQYDFCSSPIGQRQGQVIGFNIWVQRQQDCSIQSLFWDQWYG